MQACPPSQSRRSNRYIQSIHSIHSSMPGYTSHTRQSTLPLTLTSNKSKRNSRDNRSSQPSLPIHACRTVHFALYFPPSQSSLPGLSLRGPRWASAGIRSVHVRGSGTVTRSSNTVSPGNIRNLGGFWPFLAPVGFRGFPAFPCKGPGTATQSSNAGFPGNIRILCGLCYF